MQDRMTEMIEDYRTEIDKIEVQIQENQAIYDDIVLEMKEKLEQILQAVKDKVKVRPFSDQVTDQRVTALEEKLVVMQREKDDALQANMELNSKIEFLSAKG